MSPRFRQQGPRDQMSPDSSAFPASRARGNNGSTTRGPETEQKRVAAAKAVEERQALDTVYSSTPTVRDNPWVIVERAASRRGGRDGHLTGGSNSQKVRSLFGAFGMEMSKYSCQWSYTNRLIIEPSCICSIISSCVSGDPLFSMTGTLQTA